MELIEGINARYCTGECKELKDFKEFGKLKHGKYGLKSRCKTCDSKKKREYYNNNKEQINKKRKEYYNNNKDYIIEKTKQHRDKNKEEINKKRREQYKNNKESINKRNRYYYERNKKRILESNKEYKRNNKDYYLEKARERYALKKNSFGNFTEKEFRKTLEWFDYKCAYSGETISYDLSNCHREHVVPLSKGGDNGIWNIVPSLDSVNLSKHNSDMEEWYRKQPYFSEERLHKIYEYMNLMEEIYLEDKAS